MLKDKELELALFEEMHTDIQHLKLQVVRLSLRIAELEKASQQQPDIYPMRYYMENPRGNEIPYSEYQARAQLNSREEVVRNDATPNREP